MNNLFEPLDAPLPAETMPPAQKHSQTSVDAAVSIKPATGALRTKVFDYIRQCGVTGATDEEIQTALGMNPNTQRPRRVELVGLGRIKPSGTRVTTSGRKAAVWVTVKKVLQDSPDTPDK